MEPQTRTAFGPPIKHSRRRGPSRGTTLRSARRSRGANGPMIGHSPSLSRACSRAGWPHDWQTCHPLPSCPLRPHGDGSLRGDFTCLRFGRGARKGSPGALGACVAPRVRSTTSRYGLEARRLNLAGRLRSARGVRGCAVDRRRVDHRPHGGGVPELLGDQRHGSSRHTLCKTSRGFNVCLTSRRVRLPLRQTPPSGPSTASMHHHERERHNYHDTELGELIKTVRRGSANHERPRRLHCAYHGARQVVRGTPGGRGRHRSRIKGCGWTASEAPLY